LKQKQKIDFILFYSKRCERQNVICKYGDYDCLKKPMKIFYSYSSFSRYVPVPIRIFTTRIKTYSRRIRLQYDLNLISRDSGAPMSKDYFTVKQVDGNTFDVYLLEPSIEPENWQLDLRIEFYSHQTFSSCLLNKIFIYITD
jgi:hypothetical protein